MWQLVSPAALSLPLTGPAASTVGSSGTDWSLTLISDSGAGWLAGLLTAHHMTGGEKVGRIERSEEEEGQWGGPAKCPGAAARH